LWKNIQFELSFKAFSWLVVGLTTFMLFFLPLNSFDRGYWADWSNTIQQQGITNAYQNPGINYPPLVLYLLWGFGSILSAFQLDFQANIHLFKVFFLVFDLAVLLLAGYAASRSHKNINRAVFLLFNIGFWYNSLVFGQTDSAFVALAMLSVWFMYQRKFSLSSVLLALAFGFKFQTMLWLPIWAVAMLFALWGKSQRKVLVHLGKMLAAFVVTMVLIFSPFLMAGTIVPAINGSYVTSVQNRFHELSVHAFNFWHIILPVEKTKTDPSELTSFGLSYELIGYALIIITLLVVAFIYVVHAIRAGKLLGFDFAQLMLLQGIISLSVFMFSTRMHERYAHSAVLSLLVYAVITKRIVLIFLISIPYWLNLASVVEYGGSIMQGKFVGLSSLLVGLMYLAALLLAIWYWSELDFKKITGLTKR